MKAFIFEVKPGIEPGQVSSWLANNSSGDNTVRVFSKTTFMPKAGLVKVELARGEAPLKTLLAADCPVFLTDKPWPKITLQRRRSHDPLEE